jgi:hypothetical protein
VEGMRKFCGREMSNILETFFLVNDVNKDKKICETDLFSTLRKIGNCPELNEILLPDVLKIFEKIEMMRVNQRKNDKFTIRHEEIENHCNQAFST